MLGVKGRCSNMRYAVGVGQTVWRLAASRIIPDTRWELYSQMEFVTSSMSWLLAVVSVFLLCLNCELFGLSVVQER
jgi:hypothetical protein